MADASSAAGGAAAAAAGAGTTATDAADGSARPASEFRKKGAHDHHPFFSYYGMLVHQQNMMQDTVRTGAYQSAIVDNAADFAGKVVMDVGTGSGILAAFAARAGAKKVYAVEASHVADRAKALLAANGLTDVISVLKQKVEEVVLPDDEKVDVLISEPMGFMLIHERMLESYMIARQMFLKPGGKMFPSTGTIFAAPFSDAALYTEQLSKATFWTSKDFYGLDLSSMYDTAVADHFSQPIVGYIDPTTLLCASTASLTIDFEKDEPESLHEMTLPLNFVATRTAVCHGLAAWFDVVFDGTTSRVVLNTGPACPGTHWYQCRLLLKEPIAVNAMQRIGGSLKMVANDRYSYNLTLTMTIIGSEATMADGKPISSTVAVSLQDQQYSYLSSTPAATA